MTTSPISLACALVAELSREDTDYDVVHALLDEATDLRITAAVAAQLVVSVGQDDPEEAVRLVRRVAMREARRRAGVTEKDEDL